MAKFTLTRDNLADLQFEGDLVATVSSETAGKTRWTELRVYKTDGGRYICEELGRSKVDGERDFHHVTVVDNEKSIPSVFGGGWLSKLLYGKMQLQYTELVG